MGVIIYLAIFMTIIGAFFLIIFLFAIKNGQFDDLETPAHKILLDDTIEENKNTNENSNKIENKN